MARSPSIDQTRQVRPGEILHHDRRIIRYPLVVSKLIRCGHESIPVPLEDGMTQRCERLVSGRFELGAPNANVNSRANTAVLWISTMDGGL